MVCVEIPRVLKSSGSGSDSKTSESTSGESVVLPTASKESMTFDLLTSDSNVPESNIKALSDLMSRTSVTNASELTVEECVKVTTGLQLLTPPPASESDGEIPSDGAFHGATCIPKHPTDLTSTLGTRGSSHDDNRPFWLKSSCTGEQLLKGRLPKISMSRAFQRVGPLEEGSVEITAADLETTENIPSATESRLALSHLTEAEENNRGDARAWFGEPSACMSIVVLRMIHRTYELIDIKDDLLPTISWLEKTATSEDRAFVDFVRSTILHTPDIRWLKMHTRFSEISVKSIVRFYDEQWLDDDVIDCALEELSMLDTGRNRFVLIPAQQLNTDGLSISGASWRTMRPKLEQLEQEGRSARLQGKNIHVKAFGAILTGGDHWAVVGFDFVTMRVLFGHSLDRSRPYMEQSVKKTIDKWLQYYGLDMGSGFINLPVPYQGYGSGSCAVIVLNTIERFLDPRVEIWTQTKSAFHRFRLLKMLLDPATFMATRLEMDQEKVSLKKWDSGDEYAVLPKVEPYYQEQGESENWLEAAIDDGGYCSSLESFSFSAYEQEQEDQGLWLKSGASHPRSKCNEEEEDFLAPGHDSSQRHQARENNWRENDWRSDLSDGKMSESGTNEVSHWNWDMSGTSDESSETEPEPAKKADISDVVPFEQQAIPWENVPRTMAKYFKDHTWRDFRPRFWSARNTFTPKDFERQWEDLRKDFQSKNHNLDDYLTRLDERRERWAMPWVGTTFTAGAHATQRVESAHAAIKRGLNTGTRLLALFHALTRKSSTELHKYSEAAFYREICPSSNETSLAAHMFSPIVKENSEFLGNFAHYRMLDEMSTSLLYSYKRFKPSRKSDEHNAGIACCHFFRVIRDEPGLHYHVSLIKKRWFQREYQDTFDDITSRPFISITAGSDTSGQSHPGTDYMRCMERLATPRMDIPQPTEEEISTKVRYGNAQGRFKSVLNKVLKTPDEFQRLMDALAQMEAKADRTLRGEKHVPDPVKLSKTGRPSSSRLRSCTETRKEKRRRSAGSGAENDRGDAPSYQKDKRKKVNVVHRGGHSKAAET
ncbi:hypothetical protein BGX26_004808 [Mortierella sp. AD094]|nr:hypothetical protein BGX26_004808 [Mortierella sp. AD094]